MKKIIIIIALIILAQSANAQFNIFQATQGGTGIGSADAGDVGTCLKVSDNSPFTFELGACGTGGGGTGVATSTPIVDNYIAVGTSENDVGFYSNFTFDNLTGIFSTPSATTTDLTVEGIPFALPPCSKNDAVLFNGTSLVCSAQGTSFTFSISAFSDGESTTQEIGTGVFQASDTMSYTATYLNGPPTTADVMMSNNGGAYAKVGEMTASAYTTGTNTEGAINYPAAKDQTLQFRLDATDGTDADTQTDTAITFRNYVYTGCGTKANTYLEADIEALTGTLTNTINVSTALNCGLGQYIVHSYPASYTNMDEGTDYETDGAVDFKFNSIALATIADSRTLSITNSAGYAENYEVYVSTASNLGSATFVANTTDQTINPLYYGITTTASSFSEADVEGLANSSVTNDNTQTWNSVTAGTGEYLLFAFPKRLGTVTFFVGGFEGGFEAPETVSVTNSNGWTEDYYVWRSTNSGLGATIVTTQ